MTKETMKRALLRAGKIFAEVGVVTLASVKVYVESTNIDLDNIKPYLAGIAIAALSGMFAGIEKLITGYLKYDK